MIDLQDLLSRINIEEYISQYVDLEEKNGELWGISPFTFPPEKTPSFSVRPEVGRFYDFSSGIGGTLYTFILYYKKCSKREAIEELKSLAGFDGKVYAPSEKMSATMSCKKYALKPKHEKEAKTTVLPDDYMEKYEDRPEKLSVWRDEGISDEEMKRFSVMYDSFSNRIVYPIRDPDGKIVNVGGRTLDPNWKEKGLKKYCYFFQWGTMKTIYGYAENIKSIKEKREIILFEGCKSVLKAGTWGIDNCTAILTSHLSPFQMKLLAKLGCNVVFALDKDVDVTKDHNIAKLKRYVNVSYISDRQNLLDEKDSPVDKGEEVFKRLYEDRISYR